MNLVSFATEKECIDYIKRTRGGGAHRGGSGFNDALGLMGFTHQILKDKNGNVKLDRWVPNLVPTVGKALVAALMVADVGGTAVDYMAIGTGSTAAAAGDTALGTEISTGGGARVATTGTRVTTTVTNDTGQWVASWTFSSSFAVTEAGLLNASSTGTLLARQVFSAVNVVSGDTLQITWKIAVS